MQVSILCGGKSSRMQSEKGLVLYLNKPFIEYVIDAVLPISKNIQLITNTKDYDYLNYKKGNDIVKDKGPIGGIYTALTYSETELNLILSCDIPLISTEILVELIEKHDSNNAITVFSDVNKTHPLIGIYSKKCLPILQKSIDNNDLKIMNLLTKVNHQIINVEGIKRDFLKNINTVAQLKELNTY